jgi:hypothetical protein
MALNKKNAKNPSGKTGDQQGDERSGKTTERSSSQGQKASSGGSKKTNNKGNKKDA